MYWCVSIHLMLCRVCKCAPLLLIDFHLLRAQIFPRLRCCPMLHFAAGTGCAWSRMRQGNVLFGPEILMLRLRSKPPSFFDFTPFFPAVIVTQNAFLKDSQPVQNHAFSPDVVNVVTRAAIIAVPLQIASALPPCTMFHSPLDFPQMSDYGMQVVMA